MEIGSVALKGDGIESDFWCLYTDFKGKSHMKAFTEKKSILEKNVKRCIKNKQTSVASELQWICDFFLFFNYQETLFQTKMAERATDC